jgi:lipoprotein NlpI
MPTVRSRSSGNWLGRRPLLWLLVLALLAGCAGVPTRDASDAAVSSAEQARFDRALAALHQSDYASAQRDLETLVAERPELVGAWVNLGHSLLAQDDSEAARHAFKRALQQQPEDCRALTALGVMSRQEGDFAHAEQNYRRCLQAQPDFREALLNLGILYELYLGRLEEALDLYSRYQGLLEEPDPRVNGWVVDLQRRVNGRAQ